MTYVTSCVHGVAFSTDSFCVHLLSENSRPYFTSSHSNNELDWCEFIDYRNNETFIHLIKCALGTGIFAMPNAFYHAGYVVAIFCTALLGSICTYCVHMIVNIHYDLCKRNKVCIHRFLFIFVLISFCPSAFLLLVPFVNLFFNFTHIWDHSQFRTYPFFVWLIETGEFGFFSVCIISAIN